MRIPMDQRRRIDNWRRKQPIVPSRDEAVQRLLEIALAAASVPGVGSPPIGDPSHDAAQPVSTIKASAKTYAPQSVYTRVLVPAGGFAWEQFRDDEVAQFNRVLSKRTLKKLEWLSNQLKAAGLSEVSQRRLVEDALLDFTSRELEAWGVPPDRIRWHPQDSAKRGAPSPKRPRPLVRSGKHRQ